MTMLLFGGITIMTNTLKQRCELFVKNRDIMKNNFKWDNSMLHPLCASLYTEKTLEVDAFKIKMCKEIIKNNTGIFSNFKSTPFLALATMLSFDENPEGKMQEILKIYEILKKEFRSSVYLPLSAFVISDMVEAFDYERVAKKAKDIYEKMKNEHPFLTSGEDCGFAVMIAMSNLSAHDAIEEMEKCYELLRSMFFSANAVQSISHTLALGEEDAKKKCNKVIDIFEKLKNKNCKYGTGVELSVLGMLAMTTDNIYQLTNDISEVNEFLLSCKGFGALSIGKTQRIMYAAILVAQEYKNQCSEHVMNMATINSVTSIIIAQQVAITAVMASSVAVSTSSN